MTTSVTAAVPYVPEWTGLIEGWAHNFIRANVWRTEPELDSDDLLQEAFLIYEKCRTRYQVVDRAHFFALFRSAFTRKVIDFAEKRTRRAGKVVVMSSYDEDDANPIAQATAPIDVVEAAVVDEMLDKAPAPVRALLRELLRPGSTSTRTVDGFRETQKQALARLVGVSIEDLPKTFSAAEGWVKNLQ